MHDVIVVGAGPAGLYSAMLMAEEGLDVLVLEEHGAIGVPTHCTGLVSSEVQELYKIPETIVLSRPSRCVINVPNGSSVEFESPGEEIVVIDRRGLDQALATSADEAGATVLTDCPVDTVQRERDRVAVRTVNGTWLRARAAILACGVTYRFHGLLGSRPPAAVLHTAQMEVDAQPADIVELHLGRSVAPQGFAWVVPVRRGERTRIKTGVLLSGDARSYLQAFLARPEIAERLLERPGDPIRRLLPVKPAARSYGERVLAVGDAAGFTKPVTGGGIFYSLFSGAVAARELVEALRTDDLSAQRLSRYEARWRQRLMPEIRTGTWFRRLLASLSDLDLSRLIEAIGSRDVKEVIASTARFNWHRSVIMAVVRQPGIKSILLRSLFR